MRPAMLALPISNLASYSTYFPLDGNPTILIRALSEISQVLIVVAPPTMILWACWCRSRASPSGADQTDCSSLHGFPHAMPPEPGPAGTRRDGHSRVADPASRLSSRPSGAMAPRVRTFSRQNSCLQIGCAYVSQPSTLESAGGDVRSRVRSGHASAEHAHEPAVASRQPCPGLNTLGRPAESTPRRWFAGNGDHPGQPYGKCNTEHRWRSRAAPIMWPNLGISRMFIVGQEVNARHAPRRSVPSGTSWCPRVALPG